jgi:hypothetical protein
VRVAIENTQLGRFRPASICMPAHWERRSPHYPKGKGFLLTFILYSNFGIPPFRQRKNTSSPAAAITIGSSTQYHKTRSLSRRISQAASPPECHMDDANKRRLLVPHSTCWWISTPPEVHTTETCGGSWNTAALRPTRRLNASGQFLAGLGYLLWVK